MRKSPYMEAGISVLGRLQRRKKRRNAPPSGRSIERSIRKRRSRAVASRTTSRLDFAFGSSIVKGRCFRAASRTVRSIETHPTISGEKERNRSETAAIRRCTNVASAEFCAWFTTSPIWGLRAGS